MKKYVLAFLFLFNAFVYAKEAEDFLYKTHLPHHIYDVVVENQLIDETQPLNEIQMDEGEFLGFRSDQCVNEKIIEGSEHFAPHIALGPYVIVAHQSKKMEEEQGGYQGMVIMYQNKRIIWHGVFVNGRDYLPSFPFDDREEEEEFTYNVLKEFVVPFKGNKPVFFNTDPWLWKGCQGRDSTE